MKTIILFALLLLAMLSFGLSTPTMDAIGAMFLCMLVITYTVTSKVQNKATALSALLFGFAGLIISFIHIITL
jgi:hypothetical protein